MSNLELPSDLQLRDTEEFQQKIANFSTASADQLHMVFDFDRTLTVRHPDTDGDITSWVILQQHTPPEAQAQFKKLYDKYRPKELANEMTEADAVDWWTSVLRIFAESKLHLPSVERDLLERATIRPGTKELFMLCERLGIPTVILSAGVREMIEIWCNAYGISPTLIVSTELIVDENGTMTGWNEASLVHTLNKHEADHTDLAGIRAKRPFAIVIGDSIHDANMAEGDESVLRVRLLDPRPDEIANIKAEKASTFERFDVLVESGTLIGIKDLVESMNG